MRMEQYLLRWLPGWGGWWWFTCISPTAIPFPNMGTFEFYHFPICWFNKFIGKIVKEIWMWIGHYRLFADVAGGSWPGWMNRVIYRGEMKDDADGTLVGCQWRGRMLHGVVQYSRYHRGGLYLKALGLWSGMKWMANCDSIWFVCDWVNRRKELHIILFWDVVSWAPGLCWRIYLLWWVGHTLGAVPSSGGIGIDNGMWIWLSIVCI